MVHVLAVLVALAVMGIGAFAFQSFSAREHAPDWIARIRLHFIIVIGLVWGGALAAAGWAVDFPRLYAYGAALFGALVAADLLPTDYNFGHALAGVGGLIALIGIALFVRFIQRYPRQAKPDVGKADG